MKNVRFNEHQHQDINFSIRTIQACDNFLFTSKCHFRIIYYWT